MRDLRFLDLAILLAAVGSGLIGGCFFGFSTFVMTALGKLSVPQGIAAMQSINVVVINPAFMAAFVGTALLSLGLGGMAIARWSAPGSGYVLAGALLYVVGTFVATMVGNVPRNDALARLSATSPEGAALWARYLVEWTAWNHVRTVAAVAALVAYVAALRARA